MRAWWCLLLLLPATAWADYKTDYRDGVAAAERQEWAKVEGLMRKAIAAQPNPDPKAKIRMYGQRYVPYLPQFYLGQAAFSRNDCSTALGLLEDARNSNAVKGLREADRQAMMVRTCRAKLGTAVATATPATSPVPPVATPVKPAPTAPNTRPAPTPPAAPIAAARPVASAFDGVKLTSLRTRLDRANAALSNVLRSVNDPLMAAGRNNWRRQYDSLATQTKQLGDRLRNAAALRSSDELLRAEGEIAALEPGISKLGAELNSAIGLARGTALADARSGLERALTEGQRMLDGSSAPAADIQAMRQALEQARGTLSTNDIERLNGAARLVEAKARGLTAAQARGALAAQVRARLLPLANAYLSGDFQRVLAWSDEQALRLVPQAHAQALLMRAAARFEVYVLGGERDLAQLEQVRVDIRGAQQISADLQPNQHAYAPRFRALFASTR